MDRSVFEYDDYKAFTLDWIGAAPGGGRGLRRHMAEAMGCQVAYVSHVLAGDRHFSLEQAEALTRYFGLQPGEAEFFLLLVEFNRAGTMPLRAVLERQLARRREEFQQQRIRSRLKGKIKPEDQAIYYSSWHYQAIRMLLTIPQFRSASAISRKLGLPMERVSEILSFFIAKGLARETASGYVTTDAQIHLGSESPLATKVHQNWRIHTLGVLDRNNAEDLHYSSAVTISREDFARVREVLSKALVQSHDIIKPSKEERLCVLAMDFYEI